MTAPAEREVKSNRAWREECETLRERNDMSKEVMKQALEALQGITTVPTGKETVEDWAKCFQAMFTLQEAIKVEKEESPRNYYLPGEYIHDMYDGMERLGPKLREKLGVSSITFDQTQVELTSDAQTTAMWNFLDATRKEFNSDDCYMNKMLIALDERTACYLYDGRYFGFVTF